MIYEKYAERFGVLGNNSYFCSVINVINKERSNMNTITIDNNLYSEAILYAEKKRMSIAGLFESAVRNFMDSHPIKSKKSVLDSIEYKRALEAMDEIMADEQTVSVPIDEDGRDAKTEKYII